MNKKLSLETTSASLHILAMAIMLIDHLKRVFPDVDLLPCVGRIAFPIFAFLIVEGYHHTQDLNRYARRLLFFAILAEVPFDLMVNGIPFHSGHQNVLWTFLLALGLVHINAVVKKRSKLFLQIPVAALTVVLGYHLGKFTNVDYMQAGVLTVLMFYFFRGRRWWNFALQFAALAYINFEMLGSYAMEFTIWGHAFSFPRQGLAMLALIPIWLYRGKQGYHSKWLQYLNYGFYPGHMLVIAVLAGSASPGMLLAFPTAAAVVLVWRLMGEKARGVLKWIFTGPVFWTAAALAMVVLILLPYRYMEKLPVDRVNVFYYEDLLSVLKGEPDERLSITNPKDIEAWLALRDEAAPEEKRTWFHAFSSNVPSYHIWFIKGSAVVEGVIVTQREAVLYDQNFNTVGYVGYTPLNPYFEQVGEMMAAK